MNKTEYYAAYEEILMSHPFSRVRENKASKIRKDYPRSCFSPENSELENFNNAVLILQYAFRDLLGWDAETCLKAIDKKIIDDMKLTNIQKYLMIPDEYNGNVDPGYYTSLIYPEKVKFDRDLLTIRIYEEVLAGKMIDGRKRSYPKRFFDGEEGKHRAAICLIHALQKKSFHTNEEIYNLLADTSKEFLNDNKLILAESEFETPIDYLHDSLGEDNRDEFLYAYYKFSYLFNSKRQFY